MNWSTNHELYKLAPIPAEHGSPQGVSLTMPISGGEIIAEMWEYIPGDTAAHNLSLTVSLYDEWEIDAVEILNDLLSEMLTDGEGITPSKVEVIAEKFHRAWTSGEFTPEWDELREAFGEEEDPWANS